MDHVLRMIADAYSVKHIKYKWKDGSRKSVDMDRSVQLPQFSVGGFRTRTKLEVLSTGEKKQLMHCYCSRYDVSAKLDALGK